MTSIVAKSIICCFSFASMPPAQQACSV